MAHRKSHELLYAAFKQFVDRCLISDQSLLWPDTRVWTTANLEQVIHWVFDDPNLHPELSFEDKLIAQLAEASSIHWMLIADIYYVYFIPSFQMSFRKRLQDIRWAAQHASVQVPPENSEIWQSQQKGFSRTGLRYHQKFRQFWLLLLFAEWIKKQPDRAAILADRKQVQAALDNILETQVTNKNDRAYDMRSAILYLLFPAYYEPIISTSDKLGIIKVYGSYVNNIANLDSDEALLAIRAEMSKELDNGTEDEPFSFYQEDLKEEWRMIARATAADINTWTIVEDNVGLTVSDKEAISDDVKKVLRAFDFTRNVILYGPPGTGKTYVAQQVTEALVKPQVKSSLTEEARFQRAGEGLSFWERLAVSLYHSGADKKYSVAEIQQQPLVRVYYRSSPIVSEKQNIWNNLQTHTSPASMTVKTSVRREPHIFEKDDQSRWYLTKAGADYVAQNYAETLEQLRPDTEITADSFISWVTFHQSYSYEDFIEGLRPVPTDEGDLNYAVVPGAFWNICDAANHDPQNKYIIVIDEINRGNIAKIFGELITLLEDDKRSMPNKESLKIRLTYSRTPFSIPNNVYVLGTMNTADRSIALLDIALRRRFAFVELMPRPELLGETTIDTTETSVPLRDLLHNLNQGITRDLGRDYQIGHSYFLKVADNSQENMVDSLEFVWRNQVFPLLKEYYYSQPNKLAALLRISDTDSSKDDEFGGIESNLVTRDDLLDLLARIADSKLSTGDKS